MSTIWGRHFSDSSASALTVSLQLRGLIIIEQDTRDFPALPLHSQHTQSQHLAGADSGNATPGLDESTRLRVAPEKQPGCLVSVRGAGRDAFSPWCLGSPGGGGLLWTPNQPPDKWQTLQRSAFKTIIDYCGRNNREWEESFQNIRRPFDHKYVVGPLCNLARRVAQWVRMFRSQGQQNDFAVGTFSMTPNPQLLQGLSNHSVLGLCCFG